MSKEKQIDIIAKIIMTVPPLESTVVGRAQGKRYYTARHIAKYLVENGVVQHRERYLLKENGEIVPLTPRSEWISVDERLPTVEEQARGLVGIVNGYNGKIRFENARVFLNYDYNYNEWYSQDYDIQNCKIECWMPLPEAPKKGGVQE